MEFIFLLEIFNICMLVPLYIISVQKEPKPFHRKKGNGFFQALSVHVEFMILELLAAWGVLEITQISDWGFLNWKCKKGNHCCWEKNRQERKLNRKKGIRCTSRSSRLLKSQPVSQWDVFFHSIALLF